MIEYNEAIHKYLNSLYPISRIDLEYLLLHCNIQKFEANDAVVDFGDKPETVFMLTKGVVRSFIILENGKEVTKSLFTPIDLFSSFTALLNQTASKFCYQALTNCEVIAINFLKLREISSKKMDILKLYVGYLEHIFSFNEERHLEVLSKDAKERYLALRDKIPNIDNLIPQYQIAAYLNITPVQLSRIRSTIL